jgi:hypothetical protein
MTLHITTVYSSIAVLVIPGVTVKDVDDIPVSAVRMTPILFPDPDKPLSNFEATRVSYGGGSSALEDVDYDLRYLFLYAETGSGRTGLDYHKDRMEKMQAIWDAVISVDVLAGAVDITPNSDVEFIATIQDPSGTSYLGCYMSFHVKEFWR